MGDDPRPPALPGDGKQVVQGARTVGKVLSIVVPGLMAAILAVVGAYRNLADETRLRAQRLEFRSQTETQRVKNESEAGYQLTRETVLAHDRRLAELEQFVRQLAGQHPAARRGGRPRLPTPVTTPRPLPGDLEKAERQISRAAAPAPPPPMPAPGPAQGDGGWR
jgi:hypothetical protein